jgi:hypothetical protein
MLTLPTPHAESAQQTAPQRAARWLSLGIIALCLPLLALAAYGGFSSRLMADDYCTMEHGVRYGLIEGLIVQYNTWAGQFTNTTLKNIMGIIGAGFQPLLTALVLVLWWGAATVSAHFILHTVTGVRSWRIAAALALLLIFTVIAGIPSLVQPFYWQAAVIPYTVPVIFLSALIGLFACAVQQPRSWVFLTGVFIVAFIGGGLSEVYVSLQTGIILTATGLTLLWPAYRRRALPFCLVALAASLLAMIIIVMAPGNALRQGMFELSLSPLTVIERALLHTIALVFVIGVNFAPLAHIALFGAALVLGAVIPRRTALPTGRTLAAVVLVMFGGVGAYMAAGWYGIGSVPPARSYTMVQFTVALAVLAVGWTIGQALTKHTRHPSPRIGWAAGGVLAVLAVSAIGEVAAIRQVLPAVEAAAQVWDQQDRMLRAQAAAGNTQVTFPVPQYDLAPLVGLETIGADPDFWVNRCAAVYYSLQSVQTVP